MPDQNGTPDPTTPPPANGDGGTGGQPAPINWQNEAEAYKKRFGGLQSTYQKLHDDHETLKATNFDLGQKFQAVTGEYEARKLEWQKTAEQHQTVAGELDVLKATHDRLKLVMTEFPDLIQYEAKGLLPDGSGDDLKAKLKAFQELLKANGQQAAQTLVQGATPPAPATGGPRKAADILVEANKALREGKIDQYEKLYSEFVQAKAK